MTIHWWRSWHGAPTDHKWQAIALRSGVKVGIVSAVAWALMDYASQQKDRGTIGGFDAEIYAAYSGFEETEIVAVIKAMTDKGVIVEGRFSKWEERQPKREDDSAERVREFRERKRNVTHGNAGSENETIDSVSLSISSSESINSSLIPSSLNSEPFISAWEEWKTYRKESKHKMTQRTEKKQLKMLAAHPPSVAAAIIERSITNGWQGLFPLKDNGNNGNGREPSFAEDY